MEHQHPASRGEGGRDDARHPVREPSTEKCDQRDARDREDKRDDAEPSQTAAEMHDQPGETEVERRSPAFCDDRAQDVAERAAPDEERERFVLVGRPGAEKPAEDPGQRRRDRGRRGPERVHFPETRGLSLQRVKADSAASVLNLVPTYEYKCPNGHVFEVFKRIADPPPEACPVCGASPVETVLYPVPVHFRGSGFYSTDYGRGGRKRDRAKESASESGSDSGSGDKKDKTDTSTEKKKAAEA